MLLAARVSSDNDEALLPVGTHPHIMSRQFRVRLSVPRRLWRQVCNPSIGQSVASRHGLKPLANGSANIASWANSPANNGLGISFLRGFKSTQIRNFCGVLKTSNLGVARSSRAGRTNHRFLCPAANGIRPFCCLVSHQEGGVRPIARSCQLRIGREDLHDGSPCQVVAAGGGPTSGRRAQRP